MQTVFLRVTPSTALVFLLALLTREVPLRGRGAPGEDVRALRRRP